MRRNRNPLLRPGTRRHSMYIGTAAVISTTFLTQGSVLAGYGYHFFGTYAGPTLGIELKLTGNERGWTFQNVLQFAWNLQIGGKGIYFTPYAGLGYTHGYAISYRYYIEGEYFALQAGLALTIMLNDRFTISLRTPLEIALGGENGNIIRFSPTVSVGATF